MKGLIDCNNFFVSCERIFNPRLRGVPVLVLTNNDGCIAALSNEAKALGLKRGDPYFRIKQFCERQGVHVLSGNHRLYGDISSRVMATIASLAPDVEVYSVDEAFVTFDDNASPAQTEALARELVRRVRRDTGIPSALGIAPTRTLAKISASFAKSYPAYHSVCAISNDTQRRRALELTPIGKVWGIGRRLRRRLAEYGMSTALDFADRPEADIRQLLNITGVNTWAELNGTSCIEPEDRSAERRQMCCTRTFATNISDFNPLSDIVGYFASTIGRRLRRHGCAAPGVAVFLHTNSRRPDLPQYCNSAYQRLEQPTADTMAIAEAASKALKAVYRKGYAYKRAGLIVSELCPLGHAQPSLFVDAADTERHRRLMETVDRINAATHYRHTVHIASAMPVETLCRCEMQSPSYTMLLSDIIKINTSANGL